MQIDMTNKRYSISKGDSLELLKGLPNNSIDSLVTDPPAGVSFMNKSWDDDKGGRKQWIAWLASILEECYRVMKPGAHGLVWALPRTSHWTATAIEDAGFEIRDRISHIFGTGFPKSLNVSKEIDKKLGAKREKGTPYVTPEGNDLTTHNNWGSGERRQPMVTEPVTDEAKQWDGWGTALKPAMEDWWLIRKPLEGTVAGNVLKWGTGGLNIETSRIPTGETLVRKLGKSTESASGWQSTNRSEVAGKDGGRWPSHVIFSHSPDCELVGTRLVHAGNSNPNVMHGTGDGIVYQEGLHVKKSGKHYATNGKEEMEAWNCAPDCPVAELNSQSGIRNSGALPAGTKRSNRNGFEGLMSEFTVNEYNSSSGGASRFFYCAKPSRREKDKGLDHLEHKSGGELTNRKEGSAGLNNPRAGAGRTSGGKNTHPTVKGTVLMSYLIKLVTPPNGIVLDPFSGSGSTGVAALQNGFKFIGMELEQEYFDIMAARLEAGRGLF